MKKFSVLLAVVITALFLISPDGHAFKLGNKEMVKAGTGTRTKFPVGTLYYASLFVPDTLKGKPAADVINADEPMSVIMLIDSGLLSKDKFVAAIREGFGKAASSGFATDKVDQFLGYFASIEIKKGDTISLFYVPGAGLSASYQPKGGAVKTLGTVPGLPFKKALYAIWLGPNPVQESLKKGMLGK